jgi:hypothetical protein
MGAGERFGAEFVTGERGLDTVDYLFALSAVAGDQVLLFAGVTLIIVAIALAAVFATF